MQTSCNIILKILTPSFSSSQYSHVVAAKMMKEERVSSSESSIIQSRVRKKTTITRLVISRQWSLLEKLMKCDRFDIPIDDDSSIIVGQHSISEDLIVHFICRFQAPFRIVVLFEEAYPESLSCFDAMGRYPLHIACAWGNSPDTIKFLIDSYPDAAMVQDANGKCAIHHLCHTFKRHYQDATHIHFNDSMMAIVKILHTAAPMSFNIEDNDGKNAVEYAIESEVNIQIIRAMQRVCRDVWLEMKEKTKNTPHDTLQMDLQRIQRDLRYQQISSNAQISKESSSERVPLTEG